MNNCATLSTSVMYVKDSYNVGMKPGFYEMWMGCRKFRAFVLSENDTWLAAL